MTAILAANLMSATFVPLTSITQVLSDSSTTGGSMDYPEGIQAGDIIVVFSKGSGTTSTLSPPTGFTQISALGSSGGVNQAATSSYKIATGSESGAIDNLYNQASGNIHGVVVFRGNTPITSISLQSVNSQGTSGNPTPQTVTASGGTPPLIVLGFYTASTADIDPRTFSPAEDGELLVSNRHSIKWKIYNVGNTPSNHSVDMDDEANQILASCYLQCA